MLRTENKFNPTSKGIFAMTKEGDIAFEPKIGDGGAPKLTEDGHIIYRPRLYFPVDTLIEWFWTEFPNGRIETQRLTPDAIYSEKKEKYILPDMEIAEVYLYQLKSDEVPIATGYGRCRQDNEIDALQTACSLALKDACRRAGFGVDMNWDKEMENMPSYIEKERIGEHCGFIPIHEEKTEAEHIIESPPITSALENGNVEDTSDNTALELTSVDKSIDTIIKDEEDPFVKTSTEDPHKNRTIKVKTINSKKTSKAMSPFAAALAAKEKEKAERQKKIEDNNTLKLLPEHDPSLDVYEGMLLKELLEENKDVLEILAEEDGNMNVTFDTLEAIKILLNLN